MNISEVKIGDDVITSPTKMAEAFNSYFSNVGVNLAAKIPSPKFIPESYLKPTNKTYSIQTSTIATVCRLLKSIDEKKSLGLVYIPNKLLKVAADLVALSLTVIFTQSTNTGVFPSHRKEARVSPLHKNGVKNDPSNYRPYIIQLSRLSQCQSGFRSLHTALTALLEATNDWCVNVDNVDLKKAFDTIDHGVAFW